MSATALIARAEAAGMRLRLDGERVRFTAPKDPPPDLLADLRQHREAVRSALAAALPPTPAETPNAWGLTGTERAAAVARLEAAEAMAAAPAPPEPPPPPALPWWQMPYGAERGRAFADARAEPGACPHCAGRGWWRRAGSDEAPTCTTCHPPPPGLAVQPVTT